MTFKLVAPIDLEFEVSDYVQIVSSNNQTWMEVCLTRPKNDRKVFFVMKKIKYSKRNSTIPLLGYEGHTKSFATRYHKPISMDQYFQHSKIILI